jgi:hypothetical protein
MSNTASTKPPKIFQETRDAKKVSRVTRRVKTSRSKEDIPELLLNTSFLILWMEQESQGEGAEDVGYGLENDIVDCER